VRQTLGRIKEFLDSDVFGSFIFNFFTVYQPNNNMDSARVKFAGGYPQQTLVA
jgi:hypothetical protein